MVSDLQAENNRINRLFERFSSESRAVSIATVALIISALALLMAWMSVYDAIHAKTQIEVVLESNATLKMEIRLLQQKVDTFNAKINANEDH